MASRRRPRTKTWAEVLRGLKAGASSVDAAHCKELDGERLDAVLQHVPAELFGVPTLTSLSLARNALVGEVPGAFWGATQLRRLELQGDEEGGAPHALGAFPPALPDGASAPAMALRHLNVSSAGLSTLRSTVTACASLEMLLANDNDLEALPGGLEGLRSLSLLHVLGCPLAAVPAALRTRRGLDFKTGLPDRILPWLYLGDATAGANAAALARLGVQRVLSVVQPREAALHPGLDCLNIAVDDSPVVDLAFADVPLPYFLRFALAPLTEPLEPDFLGLAHGAEGAAGGEADTPPPGTTPPAWLPPHLAPFAWAAFHARKLPPLHLHAAPARSNGSPPPHPVPAEGGAADLAVGAAPLLIHCAAGASRSATLTVALLMSLLRWPLARAFGHVKGARGVVQPNIGFCAQLLHFEGTLLAAGVLSHAAAEYSPPRSPPDAPLRSMTLEGLVQQAAGTLSTDVWRARYASKRERAKPAPRHKVHLRALVRSVAATVGRAAVLARRLSAGGVGAAAAGAAASGAGAGGASAAPAPAAPSVAAPAASPAAAHRSWTVTLAHVPAADAAAGAGAAPTLPALQRRPSVSVSDWSGAEAASTPVSAAALAAARRRGRFAPTAVRGPPPALSGLPPWAWRRVAGVLPPPVPRSVSASVAPAPAARTRAAVFATLHALSESRLSLPPPSPGRGEGVASPQPPAAGTPAATPVTPGAPLRNAASAVSLAELPTALLTPQPEAGDVAPSPSTVASAVSEEGAPPLLGALPVEAAPLGAGMMWDPAAGTLRRERGGSGVGLQPIVFALLPALPAVPPAAAGGGTSVAPPPLHSASGEVAPTAPAETPHRHRHGRRRRELLRRHSFGV